jgi:hypothetical protein
MSFQVAVVVGGMSSQKQERVLSYGPEIVVATPGRLWDLIQEGNPHLAQVTNLSYLAIDETDRMMEKGHFEELRNLLELINRDEVKREKRQNFVFSATLSLVHSMPKHMQGKKQAKALTSEDKLEEASYSFSHSCLLVLTVTFFPAHVDDWGQVQEAAQGGRHHEQGRDRRDSDRIANPLRLFGERHLPLLLYPDAPQQDARLLQLDRLRQEARKSVHHPQVCLLQLLLKK